MKEEWNFSKSEDPNISKSPWLEIPYYFLEFLEYQKRRRSHREEIPLGMFAEQFHMGQGEAQTEMAHAIRRLAESNVASDLMQRINSFRLGISYYSASQFTNPSRCPTNFELDANKQLENAHRSVPPHLKFLYDLYSLKQNSPDRYQEYTTFVSRQQLGLISRISWKEVKLSSHSVDVKSGGSFKKEKRYKILVIPTVQIGSSHISFNQVSEGTFRTLAMIFYVMTDASKCLLIEEPEVCVHHGLLAKIIGTIEAYSREKQVMFSTHSDYVLDCLKPENVFVVENDRVGTRVYQLDAWAGKRGAEALREYLDDSGTLGEYWKSGGLAP